jgi:hypothetical protein
VGRHLQRNLTRKYIRVNRDGIRQQYRYFFSPVVGSLSRRIFMYYVCFDDGRPDLNSTTTSRPPSVVVGSYKVVDGWCWIARLPGRSWLRVAAHTYFTRNVHRARGKKKNVSGRRWRPPPIGVPKTIRSSVHHLVIGISKKENQARVGSLSCSY